MRVTKQGQGTYLEYDHSGNIVVQRPCAREVIGVYDERVYGLVMCRCCVQRGTTVSVRDLFRTLPVRYAEFTKNIKRGTNGRAIASGNASSICAVIAEYVKAIHILQGYCLTALGSRISCSNQCGKGCIAHLRSFMTVTSHMRTSRNSRSTVLSVDAAHGLRDRMAALFGPKFVQTMVVRYCRVLYA